MSEKGLKSMKDEKNDLQKQIGCITGFFQLFDRHRFITGQRASNYIPNSSSSSGVKNQKIVKEKQQFSTESSITSVSSSSCSSSMSSIDFNRIIKIESSSTKQIQIPKNTHSRHHSLDFYDVVKDSIHREGKGLYVKTLTKEEKKVQHIDSPRPTLSRKSFDGGVKVSKEPLHNLSKSRKPHWDSPRLSYDAVKSATVHKELPRFSLDSKQGSVRRINEGNKARNAYERNSTSQLQELETPKRSSSVVAKLMGLEALPDSTQTCPTFISSTDQIELTARASTNDEYKKLQSSSPSNKRNDGSITNVTQHSRFALESTSPWRQRDACQSSLLQVSSKGSDSGTKPSKSSISVYGEIEKRLAELEFKKSGKDLRALKQILEAMQRFTDSSSETRNNNTSLSESSKVQSPKIQQKDSKFFTDESSNSISEPKSPIVIMKPTKVTRKANNTPSTEFSIHRRVVEKQKAKGIVSTEKTNNEPSKLMQPSKSCQDRNGNNTINFGNITVTGSPRLQKKFGFEKRSPPTSPSSGSTTVNRTRHNRQLVELSTSSCSTHRHDFSVLQDSDEHFSEMTSPRKFKHHVNVISSDFDSNRRLDTLEIVRIDQLSNINQNDEFEYSRNERSKADKIVTAEQPSPVSVLDAAFYKEDPPSPVKKISNISKRLGEALSTNVDIEENSVDQILREIDWNDEKLVNFNNIENPDHKYISEILIASGLVTDRNSNELLHSQGTLINPKLFLALEQMKTNTSYTTRFNIEDGAKNISIGNSPEKLRRKLIFDVVNHILSERKLKGKKLFEELCIEIDELQPRNKNIGYVHEDENSISLLCRDLKDRNTVWTNRCSEKQKIVLDVERLIFRDLITEVCER